MFVTLHRVRASSFRPKRIKMKARRLIKSSGRPTTGAEKQMRPRNRQHQSTAKRRNQNKTISARTFDSSQQQVITTTTTNGRSRQTPQINKIDATDCVCSGCERPIKDRYLLSACDKYWHESCLKCDRCQAKLGDLGPSLYNKSNMNLCRQDYLEMFGQTAICSVCEKLIYASEMVMRAKHNIYHLECFACQLCGQRFCVGDRFYLFENKIVCQFDYEEHILPIQRSLLGGPRPLEAPPQIDTQSCLIAPTGDPPLSSDLIKISGPAQCESKEFDFTSNLLAIQAGADTLTPTESPKLICLDTLTPRQPQGTNNDNTHCLGSQITDELGGGVRQQPSERSLLLCSQDPSRNKRNFDNCRQHDQQEALIDVPGLTDSCLISKEERTESGNNLATNKTALSKQEKSSLASDCGQVEGP